MSHRNTVTISQTDGVTSLDGLTIDGGKVFVLIVAQHSFLGTIG